MNPQTAAALREFTLKARALLENEVGEQLEGIYGWLPDGRLEPAAKYPALQEIEEAGKARQEIEAYLSENLDTGANAREARDELRRESAFTWLNRLVAFKMMETRNLIRQTVTRGTQSRGFLLWLTEPGNEAHYARYEEGDLPRNRLGEGPSQEAYRRFILSQCASLAREIRVLFDPDDLSSRFFPRPPALHQVTQWMNAPDLEEAWAPGNEETIGWVYQYFGEMEKKDVFDRLYKRKQKIRKEDIPAATQLFTPHWIVRWIVQNSLGRLWLEMHPDSLLADELPYLVPLAGDNPRPRLKWVRDITLMDPACGTMHFGLVAFDLFAAMYREELERAGSPGWLDKPSIETEGEIGASIIAHNLHGIDIDLRSVQLSALTLYLKAKALNPAGSISRSQLACASVIQFRKQKLDQLLSSLKLHHSIYGAILKPLWESLSDLETGGSLVRLEKRLSEAIQGARKQLKGQLPLFAGAALNQFETQEGIAEFWEIIEKQVIQALDFFVRELSESGKPEGVFAREMTRGFHVLDLMLHRYDVVVTNPPYMTRRNMNPDLATFTQKEYPESKGDLYAAFIERCAELAADGGRIGMITQQSFMFISSYEKMRCRLLGEAAVESMCHVGPRAFESISGEKVNTTLFVLRREPAAENRAHAVGTYFRLVKEPGGESKRRRFEAALETLRSGREDPLVFLYRQKDLDAIPGSPWVYWITPGLKRLFEELPKLEDIAQPRVGLQTGENSRFLRYWWEVGKHRVGFGCRNAGEAEVIGKKWFPYMKGGGFQRWYGNQEYIVNWDQDGAELESFRPASVIRNPDFYFRRGVTWSDLTSGRFNARLSPGGFIFDVKGSSAFPADIPVVLGLLNSSFAHYILSLINPTVSFQVGDLARLPVPKESSTVLTNLVNRAVGLARAKSIEDETTYDFIAPSPWLTGVEDVVRRMADLAAIEAEIDEEVYMLYGIAQEDRLAIEQELAERTSVDEEVGDGQEDVEDSSTEHEGTGPENSGEAGGLEPKSRYLARDELARRWISYAVGIVLGRFQPGVEKGLGRGRFSPETAAALQELADTDGVLVMDEGHPDDLPAKVFEALKIMAGEGETSDIVRTAAGREGDAEETLRFYLDRTFFKLHIQQYRKRPVYWYLQSPKKRCGVWVFHERLNNDSLFRIQKDYVEPRMNHLEARIAELRVKRDGAQGRERRELEKQMAALGDILDDVRELRKTLDAIIRERGFRPHIDDGVLLNMAPLWELIPSWQAEPKKAWKALENEQYEWSHQAMDHWPDRVKEKCRTNKSYAIAHGLEK